LAGLCSLIVMFNLVGITTFMITVLSFSPVLTMEVLAKYEEKWNWLILTIFSSTAVLDVIIATSLCYFLLKQRSVAFKRSVAWRLDCSCLVLTL
jgi:uncharacterized BrkB/YihY/UPF0761 family membrane protein